jgi:hypothetical protein
MINHLLQIIAVAAIVYWIQNILSLIILHLLQQLVRYFIIQLIKNPLLILLLLLLLLLLLKLISCVNINLGITRNSPTPTLNQFVDIILLWLSLIVKSSNLYIVLNHVAALR